VNGESKLGLATVKGAKVLLKIKSMSKKCYLTFLQNTIICINSEVNKDEVGS